MEGSFQIKKIVIYIIWEIPVRPLAKELAQTKLAIRYVASNQLIFLLFGTSPTQMKKALALRVDLNFCTAAIFHCTLWQMNNFLPLNQQLFIFLLPLLIKMNSSYSSQSLLNSEEFSHFVIKKGLPNLQIKENEDVSSTDEQDTPSENSSHLSKNLIQILEETVKELGVKEEDPYKVINKIEEERLQEQIDRRTLVEIEDQIKPVLNFLAEQISQQNSKIGKILAQILEMNKDIDKLQDSIQEIREQITSDQENNVSHSISQILKADILSTRLKQLTLSISESIQLGELRNMICYNLSVEAKAKAQKQRHFEETLKLKKELSRFLDQCDGELKNFQNKIEQEKLSLLRVKAQIAQQEKLKKIRKTGQFHIYIFAFLLLGWAVANTLISLGLL